LAWQEGGTKSTPSPPPQGVAETVRVNVIMRYSVGMLSFLCVSLSVHQNAAAYHLSTTFSGLRFGKCCTGDA